jgi:hypothetical protein
MKTAPIIRLINEDRLNGLIRCFVTIDKALAYKAQQDKGLWLEYEIDCGIDSAYFRVIENLLVTLLETLEAHHA